MMTKKIKSYSELIRIPTFIERVQYLKIDGAVGEDTFGRFRELNQEFYHSEEWKPVRRDIIVRDEGCDLAMPDKRFEIAGPVIIHHINPITIDDLRFMRECVYDPENLVLTWLKTHNVIHYGDVRMLELEVSQRQPFDTCPWKRRR